MQMNQATRLFWMEYQEFATREAALCKILWGELAWLLVTLKKKGLGIYSAHKTLNRNVRQQRKCFSLNCLSSYCAKQTYKFSLSPKAKSQELRQVRRARAHVGKNGGRALCGRCWKEEYSLPVSGSTSGELVQVSDTQEHTRSCCWEPCDKLYGAPRDTPDFIKSEAIISTTIKVSWQAKTINVIKKGGGGKCCLCP